MNTPDSQLIVQRFFLALDYLKTARKIRGIATFTSAHDINRRNLGFIRKHPDSGMFQVAWLTYLCREYDISPRWLLTGFGNMTVQTKGK